MWGPNLTLGTRYSHALSRAALPWRLASKEGGLSLLQNRDSFDTANPLVRSRRAFYRQTALVGRPYTWRLAQHDAMLRQCR